MPPAADGVPSRPTDSQSSEPSVVNGQQETNPAPRDDEHRAGYEFGRESYVRYRHEQSGMQPHFDELAANLARDWSAKQQAKELPWEMAQAAARDAWDQVQAALNGETPQTAP